MTFDEMLSRVLRLFPDATVEEEDDGQIVIYTGKRVVVRDDGEEEVQDDRP